MAAGDWRLSELDSAECEDDPLSASAEDKAEDELADEVEVAPLAAALAASESITPISANTPAAAGGVTAAATPAVRRAPLRTAAAAPLLLAALTATPLPYGERRLFASCPTVGEPSEGNL